MKLFTYQRWLTVHIVVAENREEADRILLDDLGSSSLGQVFDSECDVSDITVEEHEIKKGVAFSMYE